MNVKMTIFPRARVGFDFTKMIIFGFILISILKSIFEKMRLKMKLKMSQKWLL
jgi:type III secretory pathway component EscU